MALKQDIKIASVIIEQHCVESLPDNGLSPLQAELLNAPAKIRICSAPTGAGKSYAFQRAMLQNERVLFIVPTRRLAQNLKLSLISSLRNENGWNSYETNEKIAVWNSDETLRLKKNGERNVLSRRLQEISGLNYAMDKGEMIITVPEVVSHILLRKRMIAQQTDIGVFDFMEAFDHIVFDEFHTISARGFGLAALFAKLTADFPSVPAKVSFLSATPVDIEPVLNTLDVPGKHIKYCEERLRKSGRSVHGNVSLSLWNCPDIPTLVNTNITLVKKEVSNNRQVVIIYNKLGDLQRHIDRFEAIFADAGIGKKEILLINSIDDSRINPDNSEPPSDFFAVGREQNPEDFKILIATASVEMGVTFKSNLLFMEPGFEAANFLQRYGRAARGEHDGKVLVRIDEQLLNKNKWLKKLKKWLIAHDGKILTINDLTAVLTMTYQKRFKTPIEEKSQKYFGQLPSRAAYTAGLYWNLLMKHFSNQGGRWRHLQTHQPMPSKTIYRFMQIIRRMEQDHAIGFLVKKWCDLFEKEAETLRDIGKGIKIKQKENEIVFISEIWLRRNTDLLDRFPILINDDGQEEIQIHDDIFRDYLFTEKECPYIKAVRTLRFPHTEYLEIFEDNPSLVKNWCNALQDESSAWDFYPEEMKAVKKLVQLTGILVGDEHSSNTTMESEISIL